MADLNKKLIDYGGLEHFRDLLLNDSGTTSGSTWSSSKINSELSGKASTAYVDEQIEAVIGAGNSEIEGKETEDFTFVQSLPVSGDEGQQVIIKGDNSDTLYKYVSGEWVEQTPDATKLYFDVENEALYSYVTAEHQFAPVSLVNTIVVGSNLNSNADLKALKTVGVYNVVQRLHNATKGDYVKNWTLYVESIDYEEYDRSDSVYQRLVSNYTIQKRTWSATRATNDGWSNFSTYYAGEIKDTTTSKYYTWSSNKIAAQIADAGFNVEIVQSLPASGDTHTIYFVPESSAMTSGSTDVYDEFMWVDSAWEQVGSTRIDLSDYYTVAETNALLDDKQEALVAGQNISIDSANTISADGYIFDSTNGSLSTIYRQDEENGGTLTANTVTGSYGSYAEGYATTASGDYGAHAEGYATTASGVIAHAEGYGSVASGDYGSHAEGYYTTASGQCSHAEGGYVRKTDGTFQYTVASGQNSHAEGAGTLASGSHGSHAEGELTVASGGAAHAEGGNGTTASGGFSHAEGEGTSATNSHAHSEGAWTSANGNAAHAEGRVSEANGEASHAEGYYTVTQNRGEHAEGNYNISHSGNTTSGSTLHSVGDGTGENVKNNAFEIMQNADMYIKGVGGYDGIHIKGQDSGVTVQTVQEVISGINTSVAAKQDTLTAGTNITISGTTISATYEVATNDDIDLMFANEIKLIRYQDAEQQAEGYVDMWVNTSGETMEYDGNTYYKWVSWANAGGAEPAVEIPTYVMLTNTLDITLPFNTESPEYEYTITYDSEGDTWSDDTYFKGDYTQKTVQ